jgi:hypothetical protein
MAIIFMDSFDHCNTASLLAMTRYEYVTDGWGGQAVITTGRFGNGCYLRNDSRIAEIRKDLPVGNSGVVGFVLKQEALSTPMFEVNRGPLLLIEGATTHLQVGYSSNSPNILSVYRAGTLLGTGTISFANNVWVHVELKFTIGSSGSYALRINGVQSVAATGVNTQNGGTGSIDRVSWKAPHDTTTYRAFTMDDSVVQSGGDFLGDLRVEYLVPTGAGSRTQFTPSTGSNWQTVDEVPAVDTDYNSSNSPGAMDLFAMANLSGNGLVYGVQTILRGKKDDAGFRRVRPVLYKASGSGDTSRYYMGIQSRVSDSFVNSPLQAFDPSPDTGVAWTVDEVNALQYGYAVGDAGMFTLDAKLV